MVRRADVAALLVASGMVVAAVWRAGVTDVYALPVTDPIAEASVAASDDSSTSVDTTPAVLSNAAVPPGYTRIAKPAIPEGARRVGIQVGHWQTESVPDELRRLEQQTGTSWNGVTEWSVNLDIAERTAKLLQAQGYVVDILATTIPAGYLADAFVALHADGDGVGTASGYKLAHGARRTPFEDQLLRDLSAEYGAATGLDIDPNISRGMLGYYAFSWQRYRSATAPHTPSVILEMGFLSNDDDRDLMVDQPDVVAQGLAAGIERFLNEVPASKLFGEDLVLPPSRPLFPLPSARP